MMEENSRYYCDYYKGGLFDEPEYTIFEGAKCIQYLQEYVPFHIPQIEYVLCNTLQKLKCIPKKRSILDIGSGPATVPLAFCKLLSSRKYEIILEITTVEASKGFNDMINIFRKVNANDNVEIVENLRSTFQDFISNAKRWRGRFDWVIMANCISGIGQSVDDVNRILNKLVAGLLNSRQKIILTVIETKSSFLKNCIKSLGTTSFKDLRILRTIFQTIDKRIDASWLKNCKFYETRYGNYRPYINSKSLLLELKR